MRFNPLDPHHSRAISRLPAAPVEITCFPRMPAELAVDWGEVRTLALAVGVREAARQFGISEDSAIQRSCREGWLKKLHDQQQIQQQGINTLREKQGLSSTVIKASDALANYGQETRLNHAVAAHKLSGKVAQMDADELFIAVPNVLAAAKHASVVHGWNQAAVNVGIRLDQIAQSAQIQVETGDLDAGEESELP